MRKNKNNWLTVILTLTIFVIMWIFSGWNTYNTDLVNYEYHYYEFIKFDLRTLDVGFFYLMGLLGRTGLKFEDAKIVLYGIAMLIVCVLTYKRSKNPVIVLLIFFSYHFVRDVVEMRHFFAFVVLYFVIPYIGSEDKRDKIILLSGILLATLLHISYFSFVFLLFVKKKKSLNPILYFSIFFTLSFVTTRFMGEWVSQFGIERLSDKLDGYLDKIHIANIASLLVLSFSTAVVYYFSKRSLGYNGKIAAADSQSFSKHRDYSIAIYNINILSSVFIALSAVNFSFTGRLYGNIVFLNFIYIINYFSFCKKANVIDYFVLISYLMFVCEIFSMAEMHYIDVFTNNSIISL